jgi:hypothetical protein
MSELRFKQALVLLILPLLALIIGSVFSSTNRSAATTPKIDGPTQQQHEKPCGAFSRSFYKEQLHSTVTKLDRGWLLTEATIPYSVWQTMNKGQRDLVRVSVHCTFGPFRMVSENGIPLD